MNSRSSQIKSKSCRNWFENRTVKGTKEKAKYLIVNYLAFFFYMNFPHIFPARAKNTILNECFSLAEHSKYTTFKKNKAY